MDWDDRRSTTGYVFFIIMVILFHCVHKKKIHLHCDLSTYMVLAGAKWSNKGGEKCCAIDGG